MIPTVADSDGDGIPDGADPQPTNFNSTIPALQYAVFADNDLGTMREQITDTKYKKNHVFYAPPIASAATFLIWDSVAIGRPH